MDMNEYIKKGLYIIYPLSRDGGREGGWERMMAGSKRRVELRRIHLHLYVYAGRREEVAVGREGRKEETIWLLSREGESEEGRTKRGNKERKGGKG